MIEKKTCCSWHSINGHNDIPKTPVAPSNTWFYHTCPLQGVVCLIKLIITLSSICHSHRISIWHYIFYSFFTLSPYVYHENRVLPDEVLRDILKSPVASSKTWFYHICPWQGLVCLIKLILTLSSMCQGNRISIGILSPQLDSFFIFPPYVYLMRILKLLIR